MTTTWFFEELDSGVSAEDVLLEVICVDTAVTDGLLRAGVCVFIAYLLSVVFCLFVVVPTMPKQPVESRET